MDSILPGEVLEIIITHFELPAAKVIATRRREDERRLQSSFQIGPHDQILRARLQTLASLARTTRRLCVVSEGVLYKIFPGHKLVDPLGFLAALAARPGRREAVKEVVVDAGVHYYSRPPPLPEYTQRLPMHHYFKPSLDGTFPSEHAADRSSQLLSTQDEIQQELVRWRIAHQSQQASQLQPIEDGLLPPYFLKHMKTFRHIIFDAAFPDSLKTLLLRKLAMGEWDAIQSLLLLMCTHVMALQLSLGRMFGWSLLQETLSWLSVPAVCDASSSQQDQIGRGFQTLQWVDVRMPQAETGLVHGRRHGLISVSSLLRVHTLERVSIQHAYWLDDSTALNVFGRTGHALSKGLRWLQLTNCTLDMAMLTPMLAAFPSLKSLEIQYTQDDGMNPFLDGSRMGRILRTCGQRLEHLLLDSRRITHRTNTHQANVALVHLVDEALGSSLGGLRNLWMLRTLTASPLALIGKSADVMPLSTLSESRSLADSIPPSLEQLTVLGSLCRKSDALLEPTMTGELKALLSNNYSFPKLQSIRIHGSNAIRNEISHADWSCTSERQTGENVLYTYRRRPASFQLHQR